MRLLIRHKSTPMVGHSMPFAVSGWIHGFILAWIALSPGSSSPGPRSLYEQQIQPHEKRLIWYNLREKLPDISPSGTHKSAQPPRAREKFNQTIAAGKKDVPGPRQLISMPAPEIKNQEALPLPNAVAVAPARALKPFTTPAPRTVVTTPVTLAEAPRVTPTVDVKSVPIETRVAKPPPRAFRPPTPKRPEAAPEPVLPDAPSVSAGLPVKNLPLAVSEPRAPRRGFTPPPQKQAQATAASALADAPSVRPNVQQSSLPLALPDPRAPLRSFTPPTSGGSKTAPAPDLPAAPEVGRTATPASHEASLAIVGMNPVKAPDFPTPPGSRQAGFSAGPQIRPKGGDAGGGDVSTTIVVPGLLVRGGDKDSAPKLIANASPTSKENLLEAARTALGTTPPPPRSAPASTHATRVSSSPDPRLDGRAIYTVAIQMPNITSYSGSWIVWFAEHEPLPGAAPIDVRPPVPLRKVDPKYIAAAAEEKVEGTVRLSAVIRKDGTVQSVALLHHLDDRLDLSAQEALAKWVFKPALRDGTAMDVDAVFEIPFHLAPKPDK